MQVSKYKGEEEECTLDGSVDYYGRPAIRDTSGRWVAGTIILGKLPISYTHMHLL